MQGNIMVGKERYEETTLLCPLDVIFPSIDRGFSFQFLPSVVGHQPLLLSINFVPVVPE
jgi:hypothetical protein